MRVVFFTALLGLSTALGGCAFIDRSTDLPYSRNLQVPKGSGVVYIAQPTAKSLERDKNGQVIIGPVRNGYGMHTANVLTTSSVPQWIANAYATELTAGGFEPKIVDKLPPGCSRGIEIDIQKVYSDLDMGFWTIGALGEVNFRLQLYCNGQLEKVLQVDSQGQGPRAAAAMPDTLYRDSLKESLRAATRESMPIIAQTLRETK